MEASVPGPHAIKLHLRQQNKHAGVPRSHEMGTPGGGGESGGEQHGDDGMDRWGGESSTATARLATTAASMTTALPTPTAGATLVRVRRSIGQAQQ